MSQVLQWQDLTREQLKELLPGAVVIFPVGSTEQHGPHLPVRTDLLIAEYAAQRAAEEAARRGPHTIIVTPGLPFGASAHHVAFGGTLSLNTMALVAVLEGIVDSIEKQGGRRLLFVNGHGGNRGACGAVASAADARPGITVATVDYWDVATDVTPGHAGRVETSMVMAIAPELVKVELAHREVVPRLASIGNASYHGSWLWHSISGYTDDPTLATAEDGVRLLGEVAEGLATMMIAFGNLPG